MNYENNKKICFYVTLQVFLPAPWMYLIISFQCQSKYNISPPFLSNLIHYIEIILYIIIGRVHWIINGTEV